MQTHSRLADAVPAARMSREKCYIDPDVGRPHEHPDVILAALRRPKGASTNA